MSRESYTRGFIKAARARGVDPEALAKYASGGPLDLKLDTTLDLKPDSFTNLLFPSSKGGSGSGPFWPIAGGVATGAGTVYLLKKIIDAIRNRNKNPEKEEKGR